MSSTSIALPARYVFDRRLRIPHFVRALVITVVGGVMVMLGSLPPSEDWKTLLGLLGLFVAI